jgi:hypothetical protein
LGIADASRVEHDWVDEPHMSLWGWWTHNK